jgi:hypothetical protein
MYRRSGADGRAARRVWVHAELKLRRAINPSRREQHAHTAAIQLNAKARLCRRQPRSKQVGRCADLKAAERRRRLAGQDRVARRPSSRHSARRPRDRDGRATDRLNRYVHCRRRHSRAGRHTHPDDQTRQAHTVTQADAWRPSQHGHQRRLSLAVVHTSLGAAPSGPARRNRAADGRSTPTRACGRGAPTASVTGFRTRRKRWPSQSGRPSRGRSPGRSQAATCSATAYRR